MIENDPKKQQICKKHNLPQELINPDRSNSDQLYACNQCIVEYYHLIPIQQIRQSNQKIIKNLASQLNQNQNIWNISIHSLLSLRETLIQQIKMIESIIDQIRNQVQQTKNEFKNVDVNCMESIKIAHESYIQSQLSHQRNVIQQIKVIKQNISFEKLVQELSEINLQKLDYDDSQQNLSQLEIQKIWQQFMRYEYEQILEASIKSQGKCNAIAFNPDGSVVIAGCGNKIKVFEFKKTQLMEIQSLSGHQDNINCLQFMNKSNQFISGCGGNDKIYIWEKVDYLNKWINIHQLYGHSSQINTIIINSSDDLIVSGSYDKEILFQSFNKYKWGFQQLIECSSSVLSLNFNDSNTKLISCEYANLIQVFEQQEEKWIISQKIQVESSVVRSCFISDDQFVFLSWRGNQLHFYKFDLQTNKFDKQSEVELASGDYDDIGFPIKFIKSKNLLIVKNFQFVNILRRQENFEFIKEQSIEFKTAELYGEVSQDGDFMVTWDTDSQEYQVRHLKQIQ